MSHGEILITYIFSNLSNNISSIYLSSNIHLVSWAETQFQAEPVKASVIWTYKTATEAACPR